jgi:hypothetical protein
MPNDVIPSNHTSYFHNQAISRVMGLDDFLRPGAMFFRGRPSEEDCCMLLIMRKMNEGMNPRAVKVRKDERRKKKNN